MTTVIAALWAPFTFLARHLRRLDMARGSIDMTDARTLWEQQTTMRQELTSRISALEAKVAELLAEITGLHDERTVLLVKIAHLETRLALMEAP